MCLKYVAVWQGNAPLPERDVLIRQAWGDVPVSYVQDHEIFDSCSFLDLKINKWEMNSEWSIKQDNEPLIRIEIFKGLTLEEYLRNEGRFLPVEAIGETLLVFELDEGGGALDDLLLLRLVSVFYGSCKVYKWCDGFKEVSKESIASLPMQHIVLEQLLKCDP